MSDAQQKPIASSRSQAGGSGSRLDMLELEEYNEAGELVATYVESQHKTLEYDTRIDTIRPSKSTSAWQSLLDAFLPAGFPSSVTDDYLEYQIFDSFQAFASSIAGLISSRAALEGVGVGDATASPTTALLYSIVQETMGRIATILFAWRLGKALEPECKMYRFAADVFNDTAMAVDCLSPMFPRPMRVVVLSGSSTLRALCGVAAGSSKASLSAHFARAGNLGELNAKDSSQETVISLMGMLVGTVVVARIPPGAASWVLLLALLGVHLGLNYRAVRAVKMQTLNRQRCNLLMSTLAETGRVLTPEQVSRAERIFEVDGMLRWGQRRLGRCEHGVSLSGLMDMLLGPSSRRGRAAAAAYRQPTLHQLAATFADQSYLIWYDAPRHRGVVVLKRSAQPLDQVRAWTAVLLAAKTAATPARPSEACQLMAQADSDAGKLLDEHARAIRAAGWNLDVAALETRPGRRISGV